MVLNKEKAWNFIKTCHTIYGRDLSDTQIKDHMACGTKLDNVDWLRPSDIFWIEEIPPRSIELVELIDMSEYTRMDYEILGTLSILDNIEVGSPSDWLVLPVD